MVKIVNGMIVADNDANAAKDAVPFGGSMGSSDFELNIDVCGYTLDKWKIMIAVGLATLFLGLKGLMLSVLCFFFLKFANSRSPSGSSSFGGSNRGPQPGRPNIKGINDYPKPKRG